jgi:hypothetical protein
MNEIVIKFELKHYNMFRLWCQFLTNVNKTIGIDRFMEDYGQIDKWSKVQLKDLPKRCESAWIRAA